MNSIASEASERIKNKSEQYINVCWPEGCDPMQKIEIKLSFYAGMFAMLAELIELVEKHKGDPNAACKELDELKNAIEDRAVRLNREIGI